MQREDLKPGTVFGFDGVKSQEPYLVLGRRGDSYYVWWVGRDPGVTDKDIGFLWSPCGANLTRMSLRTHSPETFIRWIKHLKETTDAQTTA